MNRLRNRILRQRPFFIAGLCLLALTLSAILPHSSKADDLPVIYVSGNLGSDQTWTSGHIYMIGNITIPDGVTLNIEQGTIVKINPLSDGIKVNSGGTLNASGTSDDPIIFTSSRDDSFGGDSDGGGSSAAGNEDYGLAIQGAGGTIVLSHTDIRSGSTAAGVDCSAGTGTNSLTDNEFKGRVYMSSCPATRFTLERNHFAIPTAYHPLYVSNSDANIVDLSGTNQNTFSGMGTAIDIDLNSSTVPVGATWDVSSSSGALLYMLNQLNVSGTLNLNPGIVVKSYASNNGISVADGGALHAIGTSASPITFSSYYDDTVGGDSDGNGTNNGGSAYNYAVQTVSGMVDMSHVTFRYGQNSVSAQCNSSSSSGMVSISDSYIGSEAAFSNCGQGVVSLRRNELASPNRNEAIYAYNTDISGINLSGANKNFAANATSGNVLYSYNSYIPSGATLTMAGDSNIVLRPHGLDVQGTLNLNSGSIVKEDYEYGDMGITVASSGMLNSVGTSANPVTFTSYYDDTIGGDSNADGSSNSPSTPNYAYAVQSNGGTVSASHTAFRYGLQSINALCGSSSTPGTISIADSYLGSEAAFSSCGQGIVSMQRNELAALYHNEAIYVYNSDISGINLSGTNKNFATTTAGNGMRVYNAYISSGATLDFAGDSNIVLHPNGLDVQGTLNLSSGSIVKEDYNYGDTGITVAASGALHAVGTSTSPVVFTSYYDDTAGGDSNADGTSSTPAAGNYAFTVRSASGADMQYSYVKVKYAANAFPVIADTQFDHISISNSAVGFAVGGNAKANIADSSISDSAVGINATNSSQVTYRGSFSNISNKAITACTWDEVCKVDATYVDWGTPVGGPILSAGNLACGSVLVSPWRVGSSTTTGSAFIANCDGSATPTDRLNSGITRFQAGMDRESIDCSGGYHDACVAMDTAMTCLGGARAVALSTSPWPLPPASTAAEVNAFGGVALDGASTYLTSQATLSVTGFTFSLLTEGLKVAGTMITMAGAYNSCAP